MKSNNKISKRIISIILSIVMILGVTVVALGEPTEPPKPNIIVDRVPTIEPSKPKVGDEVTITYKIRPQPFTHNISKEKEIVLVLDSSASMDGTKMNNLKSAAKQFITKMSTVEKLKISIVTYSSEGTINPITSNGEKYVDPVSSSVGKHKVPNYGSLTNPLLLDVKDSRLIEMINNIKALGGTNTGEGIRKAEYILRNGNKDANKSIVFMSDGLPTFYSVKIQGWNYVNYLDIDNNNPNIDGTGRDDNNSNVNNSTNYAKQTGSIIKQNSYNIFSIGYGLGDANSTSNKKMLEIHDSMGGLPDTFFASDTGAIDQIFNKIAEKLESMYSIQDAKLNVNLGNDVVATEGFEVINGKHTIKVPPITYERQPNGEYLPTPNEIEMKFKIRPNKEGKIDIIKNGNLTYTDINGNTVTMEIPDLTIDIGLKSNVTIQVNDSSGDIKDNYDSSEGATQRYDKNKIKNEFGQEYKLFGDSFADIKFEGDEINYLQYQVVKSDEEPNELPANGWMEILDGSGGIPGDIDINDPGKLTQKSYDVSHMPLLSGTDKWQDKNLVFKNPFSESKEKPATISTNGNSYVTKVEYEYYNPNNQKYEKRNRWESNCIFTNNVDIGGDYKEANKTWGYLKVPKSGTYQFKTWSDDGIFAKLTKNGEEFIIADNFTPHGSQANVSRTIELDANKYYPIYMEYFNWGGWGHYQLQYTGPGDKNFKDIPTNCFYASKNKTPGESGDNSFTGSGNVKIPQEVGKYYIAYRSGTKEQKQNDFKLYKEGVYGPFIVDERFTLNRNIKENTSSDTSFDYILEYKLQPNPIRVTDIYKTREQLNGTLKNELKIEGTKIIDNIPKQIKITKNPLKDESTNTFTPAVEEFKDSDNLYIGSKLDGFVQGDVKYNLKLNPNKIEDSEYTSNPIIVRLGVSANDRGELMFSDKDGVIIYKDVCLNATGGNKEQNFPETTFKIEGKNELKSHGLFNKKGNTFNIGSSKQDVVEGMYYTIGVDIDIKRNNSKLELTSLSNIIDTNTIEVYEYNNEGRLAKLLDDVSVNKSGNIIEIAGLNKGAYVVTYTASFNSSATIDAILDNKNKEFKANLMKEGGGDNPESYLPELF